MKGIECLNLRFVQSAQSQSYLIDFHLLIQQAPSSQVKLFQEMDPGAESGRTNLPSQVETSSSVASSSINLRKQLLLVMRQLSEDIDSVSELFTAFFLFSSCFSIPAHAFQVRQDLSLRRSSIISPTRFSALDGPLTPSLPGQTQFGKDRSGSRLSPISRASS